MNDKLTNQPDRLLNELEAAQFCGLAPSTLATWRSTGRYALPFVKVGRLVRYRLSDLEAWIERRLQGVER